MRDPAQLAPEVRGTTTNDVSLYGLVASQQGIPIVVGDDVQIVWRMTGAGDLETTATAPSGVPLAPEWGPDHHSGSNYNRPGEEWAVGYRFIEPGCWHLHVARGAAQGEVYLEVFAPTS